MTDKEMAMKIAVVILGQQVKEMAYIAELDQCRVDGQPTQWQESVDLVTGSLLLEEGYRNRMSQIEAAVSKAKSGEALQTLYRELFAA